MASKHASAKRRNKPYRPKPQYAGGGLQVVANCMTRGERAQQLAAPLNAEEATEVGTKFWLSLERLKTDDADRRSWAYLTTALNMTLGMCENGLGEEHLPALVDALEASHRAMVRGEANGKYRLDEPGIAAITYALEIHDEQLKQATHADVFAAERIIEARIKQGHHYNQLSPTAQLG